MRAMERFAHDTITHRRPHLHLARGRYRPATHDANDAAPRSTGRSRFADFPRPLTSSLGTRYAMPMSRHLLLPLAAALTVGCDASDPAPLRFDPASCEAEPSSSVLSIAGLDTGDLQPEGTRTVRETGRFATIEEAIDSLTFAGPSVRFSKTVAVGDLELWEAPPADFGAMAWVDTRLAEVTFAGSVVWSGGGAPSFPLDETTVLVGGPPTPTPTATLVPNPRWDDEAIARRVLALGLRSEVVARYTACGAPSIAAHVYTPTVGTTDPARARGLVVVAGRRAATQLP